MISKELQKKLDFYEQYYFALDKPVPFLGDLEIHPVKVSDYYTFYSVFGCLTMDKNVKVIQDPETGFTKKVSNPKGLGQSYLAYVIDMMQDPLVGRTLTLELMELFELVFHIKRGFYCPECGKQITYEDFMQGLDPFVEQKKEEAKEKYQVLIKENEEKYGVAIPEEEKELPEDILEKIGEKAKIEYFNTPPKCECEHEMRDVLTVTDKGGYKVLTLKDVEIGPVEFDEFKAIVPRQNILDYEGDKYIDPELKEELDIKAKLQNSDYTSPTLEKQLVCVGIATGYTLEYLESITMRKLSMMLRLIDRKNTYYAQLQASMSGMVKFPEGSIKHWIFTDDKHNLKDELTSADSFTKKFDMVT